MTPQEIAKQTADCSARLADLASQLTDQLKRAAELGLDRRVEVLSVDESSNVHDLRNGKVTHEPGPRYQRVLVVGPDVKVIDP